MNRSRTEVLDSLGLLTKADAYVTDATVKTVRIMARSTALISSVRKAVWVRAWGAILTSHSRLCGILFHLFRPELESGLEGSSGKAKGCPVQKTLFWNKKFCMTPQKEQPQSKDKKKWSFRATKPKANFCSTLLTRPINPNDGQVGGEG